LFCVGDRNDWWFASFGQGARNPKEDLPPSATCSSATRYTKEITKLEQAWFVRNLAMSYVNNFIGTSPWEEVVPLRQVDMGFLVSRLSSENRFR
jgi:hypothetical protein